MLQGALAIQNPELATGAASGSSPHFLYSGYDAKREFFFFYEIDYGGIPGRPIGDGMDVHAWWPHVTNIPVEYAESYFPLRIERIASRMDSGWAGFHRAETASRSSTPSCSPGRSRSTTTVTSHNRGGSAEAAPRCTQGRSSSAATAGARICHRSSTGSMQPGDQILYLTAGGGGWGDPLDRDPAAVLADVRRRFLSAEKASAEYGVVLDAACGSVEEEATTDLRAAMRAGRPEKAELFDFGVNRPRGDVRLTL